jgi:hypothetical protein
VARRLQPRSRQRQADAGADEHGRLFRLPRRRAAQRPRRHQVAPDGGSDYFRVVANNKVEAEPFEKHRPRGQPDTGPAGFTTDGKTLYWLDSPRPRHRRPDRPGRRHRRKTVIAENARADIGGAMANPNTGRIEAYAVNYLKNEWVPTAGREGDLAFLKSKLKGEINVTSRTDADDKWIVAVDPVTAPSAPGSTTARRRR